MSFSWVKGLQYFPPRIVALFHAGAMDKAAPVFGIQVIQGYPCQKNKENKASRLGSILALSYAITCCMSYVILGRLLCPSLGPISCQYLLLTSDRVARPNKVPNLSSFATKILKTQQIWAALRSLAKSLTFSGLNDNYH